MYVLKLEGPAPQFRHFIPDARNTPYASETVAMVDNAHDNLTGSMSKLFLIRYREVTLAHL
jgi:hypothetical protein